MKDQVILSRENRELRHYLRLLVNATRVHLAKIDTIMRNQSTQGTVARGQAIATTCNELEYAKDQADHFGLGNPLGKPRKEK